MTSIDRGTQKCVAISGFSPCKYLHLGGEQWFAAVAGVSRGKIKQTFVKAARRKLIA